MIRSIRIELVSALVVVVVLVQVAGFGIPIATHAKAAPLALRIGFLSGIESLNPFRGINDADYLFYGLVYDYLFALDEDGNPRPNLATAATPDAYGANWTYTIRSGVQWHDGTPLTVDDVAFSINKNIENFFQLWAYEPYVNRVVQCQGGQTTECGAVVTAADQVTVYFDRPFVPGEALYVPIIQEAQWGGLSPSNIQYNYENLNPIGTGEYEADANLGTQWQNGEPLLLHRNTNYHLGPLAIDDIYLVHYSDEASMVAAMLAGDLDVAEFTPAGYATLAGRPNIARQQSLLSTQYWVEIGFQQYDAPSVNNNLNPARWDINVRQALAMATNKDYVVNTIYQGKGVRGSSLMSPLTPFWHYDPANSTMEPDPTVNLTFNLATANQLLDDAGYDTKDPQGYRYATNDISVRDDNDELKTVSAGTKLSFKMAVRQEYIQEQDTAKYLVEEWKGVGVELTYTVMLEPALNDAVYGGSVETYIWYWSGDPDPNYLLSIQSGFTLDGWSDNYWNNATYNQLYIDHLAAQDAQERQAIVRRAEKVHYESAVYIILIYSMGTWAYRTDQYIGWGDWDAHPYRQLNAFWTANPLFLDLQLAPANICPTEPTIQGTQPITAFVDRGQEFFAEASDPDGNALTWTWDWDDGSPPSTNETSGTVGTVTVETSHTWTSPGTYFVNLTVDDSICPVYADPFEVTVVPLPAQTGWINGTVTDASTTAPIGNATVRVTPGGYSDNSGPNGRYSILVPTGTYSVTAEATFFAPETQSGVLVGQGETAVVDFDLQPFQGWIAGNVRSAAGANLAGAAIVIVGAKQYSGVSGSDGSYNITAAPGTYTVTASLTGYISKNQTGVQVADDTETRVNFVLEPVPQPGISGAVIGAATAVLAVIAVAIALLVIRRSRRKKEQEVTLPPPPPQS